MMENKAFHSWVKSLKYPVKGLIYTFLPNSHSHLKKIGTTIIFILEIKKQTKKLQEINIRFVKYVAEAEFDSRSFPFSTLFLHNKTLTICLPISQ